METIIALPNREQIINHFTTNVKEYTKIARNIAGEDHEDLFQECALMVLEMPEDRLQRAWNLEGKGLKPFFIRVLCNQYRSETSKFHKDYRKTEQFVQSKGSDVVYNTLSADIEPFSVDAADIAKAVNSVSDVYFENLIWELYVEHGSLRKALAAVPKEHAHLFDLKTVHVIIKKFQKAIKRNLNLTAI